MAGGTGITPMLQIIAAVMREGARLEMSLIFANKSEDDILLRNMIESLVRNRRDCRRATRVSSFLRLSYVALFNRVVTTCVESRSFAQVAPHFVGCYARHLGSGLGKGGAWRKWRKENTRQIT